MYVSGRNVVKWNSKRRQQSQTSDDVINLFVLFVLVGAATAAENYPPQKETDKKEKNIYI